MCQGDAGYEKCMTVILYNTLCCLIDDLYSPSCHVWVFLLICVFMYFASGVIQVNICNICNYVLIYCVFATYIDMERTHHTCKCYEST